ncbi:MAG: GNAT family N-acetyltransferase [Bacteroidota bacterium]
MKNQSSKLKVYQLVSALPEDAEALTQLCRISKMHWDYPPEWLELWKEALTLSEEYIRENPVFKLLLGDQIVGFSAFREGLDYWNLDHLWLSPEVIGQGWGKILLNDSLKKVESKHHLFKVVADPNARPFYERQGFQQIGQVASVPKGRYIPVLELKLAYN